ncbi:MAG: 2-hydroxyacyl-CoA dehydratase, partial [candidate division WOR-3 bacterium]
HLIMAARAGDDGVIHVHPFACMPSTVVQPALTAASRDYDIPFLSISVDEHTAEAGFLTRVEAFISLLERRKISGKGGAGYVSGAGQ